MVASSMMILERVDAGNARRGFEKVAIIGR